MNKMMGALAVAAIWLAAPCSAQTDETQMGAETDVALAQTGAQKTTLLECNLETAGPVTQITLQRDSATGSITMSRLNLWGSLKGGIPVDAAQWKAQLLWYKYEGSGMSPGKDLYRLDLKKRNYRVYEFYVEGDPQKDPRLNPDMGAQVYGPLICD